MTGLAMVALGCAVAWLVAAARRQGIKNRCATNRHVWAYSGEVRVPPSYRRCVHCDFHVRRAETSDWTAVPRSFLRTWDEESEHDVRVIGGWGEPVGLVGSQRRS